jgi:peroxiredoxin
MRLAEGLEAPKFSIEDMDGQKASLDDYRGKRLWLILARFVACPFCSLRLADVAERHEQVTNAGVETLVVFPSKPRRVKQFVRKYAPPYRVAADPEQKVFAAFGSETSWEGELRSAINIPQVFRSLARMKMNPMAIDDKVHRMPSEYLIDPDGRIAHVHYGQELDDGFPLDEVLAWASDP